MTQTAADVFRGLRETEFPWTNTTIYLDNAAIGPLPARTRRMLDTFTAKRAAPHLLQDWDLFALLRQTRETVARLINATPQEIGLAGNTTYGLNLAAQALPLEPGDIVLVSDREFPANVYPWFELEDRGIRVELVPVLAEGWPDEERLVQRVQEPRVRVLALSLVQFSNGFKADLDRLSAACRNGGCFLVIDGIQGIGQTPFDVRATPVDVVACGAQKWLLSPWGSGFVYVREELLETLKPPVVGWMAFEGTDDNAHLTEYQRTLRSDARRFELSTLPFQDLIAMNESITLLLELGVDFIDRWLHDIRQPLLEAADAHGLHVISPRDGVHECGIVCIAPRRAEESFLRLKQDRVICSFREGAIRFAPHCYNTVDEMARVAEILAESS